MYVSLGSLPIGTYVLLHPGVCVLAGVYVLLDPYVYVLFWGCTIIKWNRVGACRGTFSNIYREVIFINVLTHVHTDAYTDVYTDVYADV